MYVSLQKNKQKRILALHPTDEEMSFTTEDKAELETLGKVLDARIRDCGERGAMVRLSSRSPKDAVLILPRVKEYLRKEIAARPHSDPKSEVTQSDDSSHPHHKTYHTNAD